MSSLPSDQTAAAALMELTVEVKAMRQSIDDLAARVGQLAADNISLRDQLAHSEQARRDLAAQADHLVDLLGEARRQLRAHGQAAV